LKAGYERTEAHTEGCSRQRGWELVAILNRGRRRQRI
jgi:hypothetical protein